MQNDNKDNVLNVPPREIPIPKHLSPEAQGVLAMPAYGNTADYPDLDDTEGWYRHVAGADEMLLGRMRMLSENSTAGVKELQEGDAIAYEITPEGVSPEDRRVYLDIHGGALIMGGGEVCRAMAIGTAMSRGARVVSVDYRMPPDHPYPAGLDDCMSFYRALLRDHSPEEIIVGGGSAGGNLAAALVLRARDEGLPMPAGAVLQTPELDLTESGDSFQTNLGVDGVLQGSLMQANLLYAGGHDLSDPYLSPLLGDFTKGFSPTFISAGTRDLFLSNAVRMQSALRNVGVKVEIHIQEAAGHGGFSGTAPEDQELQRETRLFCERIWSKC